MKPSEIKWRLVVPIQTKGDLGKSAETEAFCCYLEQREIEWRGFDLDADNRSFSSRFPRQAALVPMGRELVDGVIGVLKRSGESKLTRWDVQAHMSDGILNALRLVRFPEQAAERGGRVTAVLFPQDNVEVMEDMDGITGTLGESVDYLIVKNRFKSTELRMYEGSQLQKDLQALGAGEIEMPVLLRTGKNALTKVSIALRRNVTVREAVMNMELPLDFTARLVIEDWLRTMYWGYDRNVRLLLPWAEAEKISPAGESAAAPRPRRSTDRINVSNL